jgi:hypothetical protein
VIEMSSESTTQNLIDSLIDSTIQDLKQLIAQQQGETVVSVTIFINAYEFDIKYTHRTPRSLRKAGISMLNLQGNFIK